MAMTSQRQAGYGFLLALVVLGFITVTTWRYANGYIDNTRWVDHTHEVMSKIERLQDVLHEVESNARGYILTGDEGLLREYKSDCQEILSYQELLTRMTTDNARQQQALEGLRLLVTDTLVIIQQSIELRRTQGQGAAVLFLRNESGKHTMSVISAALDDMLKHEEQLLMDRRYRAQSSAQWTLGVLVVGVLAQVGLLIWIYRLLSSDNASRLRSATVLGESEVRYRRLFESASDGVLLVDAATARVMESNPAFTHVLGFERDEVVGRRLWEIGVFAESFADERRSTACFDTLKEQGQLRLDDLALINKSGSIVSAEMVMCGFHAADRAMIQCNLRDISERKTMASALRRAVAHEQAIVACANYGIISLDPDFKVRSCNAAAGRMLGVGTNQLVGHSPEHFHLTDDLDARIRDLAHEQKCVATPGFTVLQRKLDAGGVDEREWIWDPNAAVPIAAITPVSTRPTMSSISVIPRRRRITAGLASPRVAADRAHYAGHTVPRSTSLSRRRRTRPPAPFAVLRSSSTCSRPAAFRTVPS